MVFALALSLMTATPTEVSLVMVRRSGLTTRQTTDITTLVTKRLESGGVAVSTKVVDATACSGKRTCIVSAARKERVQTAVLVSAVAVLDDVSVTTEAASVAADGRVLAKASWEGKFDQRERLGAEVMKLVPALLEESGGIGVAAQAEPPPPPPPLVVTPVAPPPVEKSTTPAPPPAVEVNVASTTPVAPIVLFSLAGVAVAVGGLFAGLTANDVATVNRLCPDRRNCDVDEALSAYDRAAVGQVVSISGFGVGLGAAVAGVIALLSGKPSSPVSVLLTPHSLGVGAAFVW